MTLPTAHLLHASLDSKGMSWIFSMLEGSTFHPKGIPSSHSEKGLAEFFSFEHCSYANANCSLLFCCQSCYSPSIFTCVNIFLIVPSSHLGMPGHISICAVATASTIQSGKRRSHSFFRSLMSLHHSSSHHGLWVRLTAICQRKTLYLQLNR